MTQVLSTSSGSPTQVIQLLTNFIIALKERLAHLEGPGPIRDELIEDLDYMRPGMDSNGQFLLTDLVDLVERHGPGTPIFSHPHTPDVEIHRAWKMGCHRWNMGPNGAWWAPHRVCIAARDRRIDQDVLPVHVVCSRIYSRLRLRTFRSQRRTGFVIPSALDVRKDGIAKDVAVLFSQVARAGSETACDEAFIWGMCDTYFYITRGRFDAAYIEAACSLPAPLPPYYTAEVRRTMFHDMRTVEGRREALRAVVALLRYVEAREYYGDGR